MFGEIGLLPHEYYNLLPHEFNSLVKGYSRAKHNCLDQKRYAIFISIRPHIKDLNYQRFCSDVWPLPGDTGPEKQKPKIEVIDEGLWSALQKQMNVKSDYETILEKHKLT